MMGMLEKGLLILSFVLLAVAAFGLPFGSLNIFAAGVACYVLSRLVALLPSPTPGGTP